MVGSCFDYVVFVLVVVRKFKLLVVAVLCVDVIAMAVSFGRLLLL